MSRISRHTLASLRQQPTRLPIIAFLVYSGVWTVLDSVTSLLGMDPQRGPLLYILLVALSVVGEVIMIARPTKVSFRPRGTNVQVSIYFGDVFDADAMRAIPVNEFFDCEIGDIVSPRSIHGQLIHRSFGGHSEA